MPIAIMQGRLLPPQGNRFQCFPRDRWREEFPLAKAAGLEAIEWIYDLQGADVNPIATDDGVLEMRSAAAESQVAVLSVCADYFMDRPFVRATSTEFHELTGHLEWLIARCRVAGILRIVLPFVDGASMETAGQQSRIAAMLRQVVPSATRAGVEIHLETSLKPKLFSQFLLGLSSSVVRVNYDSGNSASLGFDVHQELAAYGDRIGSIHIKDRLRAGGTVPLGTGDADLPALLSSLARMSYRGDYVLQVARGIAGEELDWARKNQQYLVRELSKASIAAAGDPR